MSVPMLPLIPGSGKPRPAGLWSRVEENAPYLAAPGPGSGVRCQAVLRHPREMQRGGPGSGAGAHCTLSRSTFVPTDGPAAYPMPVQNIKPLLTVSFTSGDISLMNNYDDLSPTVIRSGLKGTEACTGPQAQGPAFQLAVTHPVFIDPVLRSDLFWAVEPVSEGHSSRSSAYLTGRYLLLPRGGILTVCLHPLLPRSHRDEGGPVSGVCVFAPGGHCVRSVGEQQMGHRTH